MQHSPRTSLRAFFLMCLAGSVWIACGASGSSSVGEAACVEGESRACPCPNGVQGAQRCTAGAFEACACTELSPTTPADGPPTCGDGKCNGDETCRTCAHDCGACAKCPAAPSCTDAVGVPSKPTVRGDLSQPAAPFDGGVASASTCQDPELRFRIASILAHNGGGEIYCVVSATDGATSEAAVTTKTKSLGDGETNYFDPSTAIYWGQKDLHRTTNNLTVTFNCFVVKSDSWAKVLKAVGDTATSLGGTPTPYGWAFGLGGIAANAAAAGVQAGAGDELRFNAQQVIDKKDLLDLTNGRTWSIRKNGGCGLFCDWDWEIFVESWGCADADSSTH